MTFDRDKFVYRAAAEKAANEVMRERIEFLTVRMAARVPYCMNEAELEAAWNEAIDAAFSEEASKQVLARAKQIGMDWDNEDKGDPA